MDIQRSNFQSDKLFRCVYKTELYRLPIHLHQFAEVIYVRRGSMELRLFDHTETVGEGQIAVIAPFQMHGFHADKKADFWLSVYSPSMIHDLLPEGESLAEREKSVFTPSPSLRAYLEDHPIDTHEVLVGYDPVSFRRMKSILSSIYEEYLTEAPKIRKNPNNIILAPLTKYLVGHHDESVSLSSAAKAVGYSESHISHCLAAFGMNFCSLLNAYRLDAAKDLLLLTDKRILDIALEAGFSCERTFNRTFLSNIGVTPTVYRKTRKSPVTGTVLQNQISYVLPEEKR